MFQMYLPVRLEIGRIVAEQCCAPMPTVALATE
jgi:hypothetical protein